MAWKPGIKVVHRAQRTWGVGVVVQVADEGRRLAVRFAGREGITVVSGRDPALVEVPPDTPIEQASTGPIDALASGQAGPASAFGLRTRVGRLEALRRADSLGALLSSRVHVLPHQVGAAGRILADRMPRFVLADEVGLGKTVEAGLVFAGLRQLGLAERVLVVVPEHLAFQWLAELFHKFNALFTLLTPERVAALGGAEAALARSPHAIVSFEALRADDALAEAAADLPLDLVVVDEAHHLSDDDLHARVAPICRASFGVLLLTATPVRLDPREYFRLLSLVEPVPSTTLDQFLDRLDQHEAYAAVACDLLGGADPLAAVERLRALAPDDPVFRSPNPIGESDWRGWVQERGLYFVSTWDGRYTPLLGMADPRGEGDEGVAPRREVRQGDVRLHGSLVLPPAPRRRPRDPGGLAGGAGNGHAVCERPFAPVDGIPQEHFTGARSHIGVTATVESAPY